MYEDVVQSSGFDAHNLDDSELFDDMGEIEDVDAVDDANLSEGFDDDDGSHWQQRRAADYDSSSPPPRSSRKKKRAKSSTSARRKSKEISRQALNAPKRRQDLWKRRVANADPATAVAYNVFAQVAPGTLVNHSKFGLGVVLEMLAPNKADVLFEDEIRKLMCNRPPRNKG